jgi:type I restriction enzyme S subunit
MSNAGWCDTLPAKWSSRRLKYASKLGNARSDGRPDGTRYLGLENVESWTGRLLESAPASENAEDAVGADSVVNCFECGDVLFGKLRPYLAKGHFAEAPGVCTTELLVTKPARDVDGKFLLYAMLSEGFISLVDSSTFGSKMPRADWDFIGGVRVPIPALAEQRAITDFLDRETGRLDALVTAKERWLELLAEKRRALITRAVTRGLNPAAPLRDSGFPWLGQVPKHWRVERSKWLFKERDERIENDDGEMLTVSHITGVTKRSEKDVNMFEAETTEGYKICLKGDLAINTLWAWMGAMGIAPCAGIVSPAYNVYTPGPDMDRGYVEALVRMPLFAQEIIRYSKGVWSSRLRLYPEGFFEAWLPVPPLAEQRAIVAHIATATAKLDGLRAAAERTIALLKERRAALIAAAVTGKIAVPTRAASVKTGGAHEN